MDYRSIDGTMNFLNGIPQFAISVGYEEDGEIKTEYLTHY